MSIDTDVIEEIDAGLTRNIIVGKFVYHYHLDDLKRDRPIGKHYKTFYLGCCSRYAEVVNRQRCKYVDWRRYVSMK